MFWYVILFIIIVQLMHTSRQQIIRKHALVAFFFKFFWGWGLFFFFKFDTYPALIRVIRSGLCNTLHDQENKVTFPISYHVKV